MVVSEILELFLSATESNVHSNSIVSARLEPFLQINENGTRIDNEIQGLKTTESLRRMLACDVLISYSFEDSSILSNSN